MNKREQIVSVLEKMGYQVKVDDDGDVVIRYQLKQIYFLSDDADDHYVSAYFHQFEDIEEGEEPLALATCNKVSREVKFVKVYVTPSFKHVSASCEFYYTDEASLEKCIREALGVLGILRSVYKRYKAELSD